ncbi:NHLP family bacteriocin export ABC transporter peptidase/permease/ATPase subunit [Massilia agilis]|nr:NHLP family bacteriocin export ABC transporter peptidase/permease/ATPase subunit [Massilia agilis]
MSKAGPGAARRVKTPTVLQMEAVECGAAALAIVLAHYGRWIPLEELRIDCGVSRNGSKASNLLKAARRHGMAAKGFTKDGVEALAALPVPSILHWNFNHFLVFEGIEDGHAWLNDPASGPRKVTLEELGESFTGVVLAMEPGPDFVAAGSPPSLLRELAAWLRHSRQGVALVALASLLLVVPGIALPLCAKVFVDEILVARDERWFGPLMLAMATALAGRALLTWLQQRYLLRLELKLAVAMSTRFLAHVMRLPLNFFSQRHPGEVASRIGASERIAQLLSGSLATSCFNLLAVVFYAAVMLAYDLPLGLCVLALVGLNLWCLHALGRQRADLSNRLIGDQGKLSAATVGAIAGIETLKAGGTEDVAFGRWAGYQAATLLGQQELGRQGALLAVAPGLLAALTAAMVLGLGGLRVIHGVLTIGDLVAFQLLLAAFSQPVAQLVGMAASIQSVKGLLTRLSDVFHYPVPPSAPDGEDAEQEAAWAAGLQGRLELRNVSYGYSPLDPPQVRDISLTVAPGARVALVGASGSGKSTLGRICCGLVPPSSGQVLLDGRALDSLPARVFASAVAYVDQEVFLFQGSLRDNLTLWDDSVPDADLHAALEDACVAAEVAAREGGLDSAVGEGGANWSGGERQRLEIARALVRDPALLVLDEATSALDTVTEQAIDAALRRRGCACVIIAHRLSTLRDCDEIIVLKGGQAVERGTHEQLLALGGEYADLIAAM